MKHPRALPHSRFLLFCLGAVLPTLLFHLLLPSSAAEVRSEILIVVGPSNHPPGSHEVAAGGRLLQHCLENVRNVSGLRARVVSEWPGDGAVLRDAATVVFIGDQFPPMRLKESERIMKELSTMMDRGRGLVCIHYATGLTAQDVTETGAHPLLQWTGGYFATAARHHQSVAKILSATITPAEVAHPVLRGWKAFTFHDEPYYNNYFGPHGPAANVTVLATALLPPEAPKREAVAWVVQRPDGGRGMGIVMPHFYRNWRENDLRKFILNGIVWTAQREVPAEGVETAPPDLASFQPVAVEPKPSPAKP